MLTSECLGPCPEPPAPTALVFSAVFGTLCLGGLGPRWSELAALPAQAAGAGQAEAASWHGSCPAAPKVLHPLRFSQEGGVGAFGDLAQRTC